MVTKLVCWALLAGERTVIEGIVNIEGHIDFAEASNFGNYVFAPTENEATMEAQLLFDANPDYLKCGLQMT